jgi:hypothetical protein
MPEPDPPNPPLAPIDIDTPCIRCNYNLRGLSPAAICPECGTAVATSLPGQVSVTIPMWLILRRALLLVILANLGIAALIPFALYALFTLANPRAADIGVAALVVIAYPCLTILRAYGYTRLALIDKHLVRPSQMWSTPKSLRIYAITRGALGAIPLAMVGARLLDVVESATILGILAIVFAATCATVLQFYATLSALDNIAKSAGLHRLRDRMTQYGSMCAVGVMPGSLLLGLGLGFAWIFYHVLLLEFFLKASAVTREHRASTGASST